MTTYLVRNYKACSFFIVTTLFFLLSYFNMVFNSEILKKINLVFELFFWNNWVFFNPNESPIVYFFSLIKAQFI